MNTFSFQKGAPHFLLSVQPSKDADGPDTHRRPDSRNGTHLSLPQSDFLNRFRKSKCFCISNTAEVTF